MVEKKLNDTEIAAIFDAFVESREVKVSPNNQSRTFKILIVFANVYVLGFLLVYYFLKNNLLDAVDSNLMTEEYLILFDGRAQIMFWLLILLNMGAYFNFAFKALLLIALVYLISGTVDTLVLLSGLFSFADRPYFSIFILSRPLFIMTLIWMGLAYKDKLEDH